MRKYGVSVFSLFPWSLGPKGPERSVKMAREAGFDGVQALPMKWWSYERVDNWQKYVLAYEDAWNYGPLWQVPLRYLGIRPKGPTALDWITFGKAASTSFPDAILSAHHMQRGVATEIHPELSTDIEEYDRYCREGNKVCWDTYHVRRSKRDGTPGIEYWTNLIKRIPVHRSIELIHVHPVKSEMEKFMVYGGGELVAMLLVLKRLAPTATAIIEVAPLLKTPRGTAKFLSEVLEQTKKFLG